MNLKDKKVLITGATGGIGNCLVKKFYQEGANILASGTNEDKLNTNDYSFFFKHLIFIILGISIIFSFSAINQENLIKISEIMKVPKY